MDRLLRALEIGVRALAMAGIASYGVAALITLADVIGRRFGLPIVGVVDLVQLFVMVGAWFVIPYAFLVGAHVSVDIVVNRLPPYLGAATRALAAILAVAIVSLMLRQGYAAFQTQLLFGDKSQQLGIPIIWYWIPLLLGLGVSVVAALITLVHAVRGEANQ